MGLLLVAGCVVRGTPPRAEEAVAQSIAERWEHLIRTQDVPYVVHQAEF